MINSFKLIYLLKQELQIIWFIIGILIILSHTACTAAAVKSSTSTSGTSDKLGRDFGRELLLVDKDSRLINWYSPNF